MNYKSTNLKSHRNRLSSLFRSFNPNESIVDTIESVPRITMQEYMAMEYPDAGKDSLSSALGALDDANYCMEEAVDSGFKRSARECAIDLNQFVIEDSIFQRHS